MKRFLLLLATAVLASLGGCQIFVDATLSSFGWDTSDEEETAAERRERNRASRERARNARARSESYERKD